MSTQIFTRDWACSETGGNMGLVKDMNPYDSDCNNLPSAGILSPGGFHTRYQRLLVKNVVLRDFLAPQYSCLLKHARRCTLRGGSTSGAMPALPVL